MVAITTNKEHTYKKPCEIIKLDKYTGKIEMPRLLLKNRSLQTIGKISHYDGWNVVLSASDPDEICFNVHKYTDGKLCPVWDELTDLKIIDAEDFGCFEISVNYTDNAETVKSIHGFSLETELAQICLHNFHVNDEDDIDKEITKYNDEGYSPDGTFTPTAFFNPKDEAHSLLHRVLAEKAPHWDFGYVTPYIALGEDSQPEESSAFQRTYTVDGESIYDFLTGTVAKESNVAFVFDTASRKISCYSLCGCIDQKSGKYLKDNRGNDVTGIGEDTTVFVSKTKLANEITISSNKDRIKNCFRIEGGDDVITDMVRAVNMNGSNEIYQFADFQYSDMSEALRRKIEDYQDKMSSWKTRNAYYGTGATSSFLNGPTEIKITPSSEAWLEVFCILNILKQEKVDTSEVDFADFLRICQDSETENTASVYWYVEEKNGAKKLKTSQTVNPPYIPREASVFVKALGIYPRLCHAYDALACLESSMTPNADTAAPGSAQEQYENLFEKLNNSAVAVSSLSNYSGGHFEGVTNNITAYAQVFLDSRFDIEVIDGTASYTYTKNTAYGTWKGQFRIRQHTNEENVYPASTSVLPEGKSKLTITVNEDELEFVRQKAQKKLAEASMADIDFEVAGMVEDGKPDADEIRNYFQKFSLNRLDSFEKGYDSCLCILMRLVNAESGANTDLYGKYEQRLQIVRSVLEQRKEQVQVVKAWIAGIEDEQKEFQNDCNFRTCLGSNELYKEFCSYRREDTYTNSNYVSDGLSDAECLAKAKELVEAAAKEAGKACALQRTVSTSLNNLFALPEFEPLYDKFALYNYIRVKTEDEILKLRLIGIEFNGDSAEKIDVTFSEQIESLNGAGSLRDTMKQAAAMATSYPFTALQAKQGSDAKTELSDMHTNGLNVAKTMLTNNDKNEVTMTESGILCRRMDDEGYYGDKQLRITGNMMAFTDDNWKTLRMAIGESTIYNPITGEDEKKYGICADAIVGDLIVGEEMFIGNENGNVQITGEGITISNGVIKSSNYSADGESGEKEGSIIDLSDGSFSFAGGRLAYQNDKLSVNGEITAKSGTIANFNISQNDLHTGNVKFDDSTGMYFGKEGLRIGENFSVDASGNAAIAGDVIASSFKYEDERFRCEVSKGFSIKNKTDEASISYNICGKNGSMSLLENEINFYIGENFNGINGTIWFDSLGFHINKKLDIGTTAIVAGENGYATICDCTENGKFYYGPVSSDTDESTLSALRGKTVRIYSHGGGVYLGSSGTTAVTSDENFKQLSEIDNRYEQFFSHLTPTLYKYNVGHRQHIGFGARAVENALHNAGLNTEEFAGLLIDRDVDIGSDEKIDPDGNTHFDELYSLRYEEFIALNTYMIQKLQKENREIRERLSLLEKGQ